MYRHILIAIDGSPLAQAAAEHGLALAKLAGAKSTAIIVTPSWNAIALSEIAIGHFEADFARNMAAHANRALDPVGAKAASLGIAIEKRHVTGDVPYESILAAAKELGTDLIVVGSHGRRGLSKLLLGSETVKLLTHSHIPILVHRG